MSMVCEATLSLGLGMKYGNVTHLRVGETRVLERVEVGEVTLYIASR